MATYENNIVPSTSNTYSLTEQHIYGSSRLGMNTNKIDPSVVLSNGNYFTRNVDQISYELSNHLGNVITVVNGKKIAVDSDNNGINDYFSCEMTSANDYYCFHGTMPNRSFNSNAYRYGGSNGQEKDDEIYVGAYTALFWEYDSRLGRRWNVDPVVKPWESSYATFAGNPIFNTDVNGNDIDKKNLPKDEQQRIANMIDPKHEMYNKDFAETYKKLEDDHTTMYTFLYKGGVNFTNDEGEQTRGQTSYGGKNENNQDIFNIEYTIGASSYYKTNSSLLEETFHADQFRRGEFGFAKNKNGKWGGLGYDQYDEAAAKMKAFMSQSPATTQEKGYIKLFNKGGLKAVVDGKINAQGSTYLGLPTSKQTALDAARNQQPNGQFNMPESELFDEQGRSKIPDSIFRKPTSE